MKARHRLRAGFAICHAVGTITEVAVGGAMGAITGAEITFRATVETEVAVGGGAAVAGGKAAEAGAVCYHSLIHTPRRTHRSSILENNSSVPMAKASCPTVRVHFSNTPCSI